MAYYKLRWRIADMTHKERILATLAGKPTDALPFVPRLDNWFYANEYNGTLPDKYKHANLREFADDLGVGFHSIVPNFKDWRMPNGDLHVGLGIYDVKLNPWRVELHNVGITSERNDKGELRVCYDTPYGKINTCVVYTEQMVKDGITLYVHKEYALKSCNDYPALKYIFDNAEVIPDYERYAEYQKNYIGDRGVAVALSAMWASSGHYMIKELMSFEDFYSERFCEPELMDEFVASTAGFSQKFFDAAINSPAEVVLSGANYDYSFTSPDIVKDFVVPELKRQSDIAHSVGKFVASHTDGENTGLTELFVESGFDIADSICPAPMTKIPLKETIDTFGGKLTIWGGIPSIATLPELVSDHDFHKIMDDTFEAIGKGDHIILSVADTLPPAASFERVLEIKRLAEEFGPVKPY